MSGVGVPPVGSVETVPCNLCGSTKLSFVYRRPEGIYFPDEWYDVVACDGCGLGFVNPRPTHEEIGRFYRRDYYDVFFTEDHTERYRREYGYLPDVEGNGGEPALLDVGCGVGDFARYAAERGWRVEGVEPHCPVPIEDFPVHRVAFDTVEGMEGHFDAVTAWAVLEHVHDPMAYFQKAGKALKPGGTFVFQVTNFDSLSSRRLFQEDVPRHLYFFTRKTVDAYLGKAGMRLVSARFGDDIFSMSARGSVAYLFTRYIRRRSFEWQDMPLAWRDFLAAMGLTPGPLSLAKFILSHPVAAADRLAEPLVGRWQKATGAYGMVTYVARRS